MKKTTPLITFIFSTLVVSAFGAENASKAHTVLI